MRSTFWSEKKNFFLRVSIEVSSMPCSLRHLSGFSQFTGEGEGEREGEGRRWEVERGGNRGRRRITVGERGEGEGREKGG